eukprot:1613581-Prymnesium_polylepis.1
MRAGIDFAAQSRHTYRLLHQTRRTTPRRRTALLAPGDTEDAHGSFYELLTTAESSLKVIHLHTIMRR